MGQVALERGDSARALRLFEAAADSIRANGVGCPCFADWKAARLLVALGAPDQAEPRLIGAADLPWFTAPAELYLGLAAERRGDTTAARGHYGRLLRWWQDCDPELQPWLEEARQGMHRVTKEVASRN